MEDKQIGILTFHAVDNYGAVLQAYALQQFIYNNISPNVNIIDYKRKSDTGVRSLFKGSTHNPVKNLILNILSFLQRKKLKATHNKFEEFRRDFLHLTKRRYDSETSIGECNNMNYFITGSDQVFNARLKDYRVWYLGSVGGNGKKVAYAPSFGFSTFTDEITSKILPLLKNFSALSCREATGAKYLSDILGRSIPVVLDPVFLLNRDEWKQIAVTPKAKSKYLLVYCLSKGKAGKINQLAHAIAKKENLSVVTIGSSGIFSQGSNGIIGPREFVGYFCKADFVLTDSFHGTSFSLIFGKRHLSYIANIDKGTRIESVMKIFGKDEEIIYDIDSYAYNENNIQNAEDIPKDVLNASKRYLLDSLQ